MGAVHSLDLRDQEFTQKLLTLEPKHALAVVVLQNLGFMPMWISKHGTVHCLGANSAYAWVRELGYVWHVNTGRWCFVVDETE
jgi:hypothetical protein